MYIWVKCIVIDIIRSKNLMAKDKDRLATTWGQKMKEYGGGNFTFLSGDGESITFIVVGLPVLMKSVYKGKEQARIGCPVVTEDGFQLFIVGKRLARKLSKHEKVFDSKAIMVVRRGGEGDVNSKYEVHVMPETESFAALYKIKADDFTPDMIDDAVKEAGEVLVS